MDHIQIQVLLAHPLSLFSHCLNSPVAPQSWKPHTDSVKRALCTGGDGVVELPEGEWQLTSVLKWLLCSLVLRLAPLTDVFILCDVRSPREGHCAADMGTDWCGETHLHIPGFWTGNISWRCTNGLFELSAHLHNISTFLIRKCKSINIYFIT